MNFISKSIFSSLRLSRRLLSTSAPLRHPSWGPPKQKIDRKDIEFRVLSCLSKHEKIDSNTLSLQTHLARDLGLDSLDVIEVCVEIEDEFSIEVDDTVVDRLSSMSSSVESVVDYVVNQLEAKGDENQRPEIEFKEGMTGNRPVVN